VRFPQPGGLELASLTHRALYSEEGSIPAVRDEPFGIGNGRKKTIRVSGHY
jgi:hypothetical protein